MKKFIMVTPLQPIERVKKDKANRVVTDPETGKPVMEPYDSLSMDVYEPVGNPMLKYDKLNGKTRFPIIPVINAYARKNEEIEIIAVNTHTKASEAHFRQLKEEVSALSGEIGFVCKRVIDVPVDYAGDVRTMVDIFRKLLDYLEDDDILYACFTYGVKPMPIAELMAIMYAYRVKHNVSIECLVYGEKDHNVDPPVLKIFDITALAHLDELVRLLAENKVEEPLEVIDALIELSEEDDNE